MKEQAPHPTDPYRPVSAAAPIVIAMLARALRLATVGLAGIATVWAARLFAHHKTPPPEGRWRELGRDDLS